VTSETISRLTDSRRAPVSPGELNARASSKITIGPTHQAMFVRLISLPRGITVLPGEALNSGDFTVQSTVMAEEKRAIARPERP
jgi:hypothetical protein